MFQDANSNKTVVKSVVLKGLGTFDKVEVSDICCYQVNITYI